MSGSPAMSPSRSSRTRRRVLSGALVVVAALGGIACGDDDEDEEAAPTTVAANFSEYCDASFSIESYFAQDPDVDFESATPEEIAAAVKTYLEGAKPLIDAALPLVPAEIKAPIDVQVAAFNEALAGADPEEVFDTPKTKAAEAQSHAFDLENCGWGKVDVTAVDYEFQGLPNQLTAGRISIDLTNGGAELHEIVLLAKNPGVTESFDEITKLPEEEAMTKVRPAGSAFASPGDSDYSVVDLTAGEYLAVCFIPQGLTSEEAQPSPDAKAHFELGMKKEITVA